jgi:beta-lactamase regulating signal transducer with metallopeptidase domain/HEAT repeat protein
MNSSVLAAFLINALVQIPLIALVALLAARALRRAPARQQHLVWVAAVAACVILPLAAMKPRRVDRAAPAVFNNQQPTTNNEPFSLDALLERTQRPAARGVDIAELLAAGYGAFVLFRIGALTLAWIRTRRILRVASVDVSEEVHARCGDALERLDVPILTSAAVATPITLGALAPVIIVPRALLDELSDRALVAVIGHELAHIRRRDYIANAVIEIATLPISFHPLTALLKRRLAESRELACDEQVTPRLVPPRDYARVLLDVASFASAAPKTTYSLTMAGGAFENRIRRIIWRKTMRHSRALVAAAWVALAVSSVAAAAIAVHPPQLTQAIEVSARFASTDPAARAAAACAAGRARDAGAIPALLAMLGDETPIPAVRCYDGRWTPALTTFHHPSPGEQAALALASISRPAIDALVGALDDRAPAVRRNAAWAIGEARGGSMVGRGAALTPLIRLLADGDATVRRAAAFGLSELKDRDAVEPLIVALGDRDAAVRGTVVFALGEIRDRRAVQTLAQIVVADGDAEVRRAAAWALGEIKDARAVDALTRALGDAPVRDAAQHALDEIQD